MKSKEAASKGAETLIDQLDQLANSGKYGEIALATC
jgi:hypothetical protein